MHGAPELLLRTRQIKNFLATLFLSQGVPMLLSGDECRRTQHGNNNAYCQDNSISWFDWSLVEKNKDLIRYVSALANFRTEQPTVRRQSFLNGKPGPMDSLPDVNWFSARGKAVQWDGKDAALTCLLAAPPPADDPQRVGRDILILINSNSESRNFVVPPVARSNRWRLFIDTAAKSPGDIFPDGDGRRMPNNGRLTLLDRSLRCYVAER